ncbi:MAG: type III pantothenate kinase [Candidatus Schekmanbacteria bacterium]|nr:type III pantothenate kinase [Candidatus Schekmanbacteria bacterium]
MLLAIDVGNTNTVIGVFDGDNFITDWRIATVSTWTADDFFVTFKNLFEFEKSVFLEEIKDVIISSVVPATIAPLKEMAEKYFKAKPVVVDNKVNTGLKNLYENPAEVGADRIVNAAAAYKRYGGPTIVVDFGTATTFCYITSKGEYCGGIIVPGIKISMDALFQKAAKLPKIELIKPPTVIGKNTVNSMQSGILYGYAALVDGLITRMEKEVGKKCFVVATGGLAMLVAGESKKIKEINQMLTIEGLKIVYELNKKKKKT